MTSQIIRQQLSALLEWGDAHVTLETAVDGMPEKMRGVRPSPFPHSAWELVDHIRRTQADILDFCVNPGYEQPNWPADYWPSSPEPSQADDWSLCVQQIQRDRTLLRELALNPRIDLTADIPHGSGQTYFRELVLVADHTSYHIGQIVALRRFLGEWSG